MSYYLSSFRAAVETRRKKDAADVDVVEASVVLSFVDSLSEIVDSLKEALRLREQEIQVWRSEHELLYDSCHLLAKRLCALHCVQDCNTTDNYMTVKEILEILTKACYDMPADACKPADVVGARSDITEVHAAHVAEQKTTPGHEGLEQQQQAVSQREAAVLNREQIMRQWENTSCEEASTKVQHPQSNRCSEGRWNDIQSQEEYLVKLHNRAAEIERDLRRRAQVALDSEVQAELRYRALQKREAQLEKCWQALADREEALAVQQGTVQQQTQQQNWGQTAGPKAPDGSTPRQQEATIAAQAETVEQRVMELKGREHYLAEREKDSVLKEFELSRWEMEVRAREKTLQLREKEMEPNTGNRGFDIRGASFQHRRPSETMQSPATAAAIAFFSPPQTQTRPGPNTPSPRKSIPQPIATRTTPQLLQATAEFCSTPSPIQHPFAFMPATPPLAPTVAARCASPMQSSGVDPLASPPEPTSSPPAPCVSQKDVWVHATTSITTASDVASCSPLQQSAPDSPSSLYTCKSFIESSPDTEGLKTPLAMHAESADGLAEQVEVTKRAEVNLNRRIQALLDHRCSTLNVAPIADSTAQLKDWAPKTVQENLAPCFSSHKVTCRSKPKSEVPRSPSSGPLSVFEDVSNEET
jgi:hypothetical protein